MNKSFGLDLAGYSTDGSALALAERCDEQIVATIVDRHCFAVAADGNTMLATKTAEEIQCLGSLLKIAPLYVDVPIDLQDLREPARARFIWQLTRRPVDRAFDALAPLADRIGSYVARMGNLWRLLQTDGDPLGNSLFETYPAASLSLCNLTCEGYKGHCLFRANSWIGAPAVTPADIMKNSTLAQLLAGLNWTAAEECPLSNDEFDAALCALTGIGQQLMGNDLNREINNRINVNEGNFDAPRGYRLLRSVPQNVSVCRQEYPAVVA